MKYVYDQVHGSTPRRVRNDCILSWDIDALGTVFMHGCNDAKLYQPATLGTERDDELLSSLKAYSYDLTEDGDVVLSAPAT